MIRALRLQNFKCFEDQSLQFGLLTLLSGLNGTGKSSVIQSLLLLRQSYQQGLLPSIGLALNGDFTRIGTAKDALFEGAKEDKISFELALVDGKKATWHFNYNREADVLDLASPPVPQKAFKPSILSDKLFHYLQAERIGPRTSFEMSDFLVRQHWQLGTRGEYTTHFLSLFERNDIPNPYLSHPEAKSLNLKDQVEAWMGEVSPGTRIDITSNSGMDLMSLQYSFVMGNQVSNNYRATNVGFGITYTLPIIVATLSSIRGTLLLIENPEAHLHPKGQAKMGELLALASSCGVQVVIETHSDHVLNGIRLAVHGGRLDPKDIQLYFFQRQEKEGQTCTEVVSPRIDSNGRIDQWPENFFDEWDKSLEALLAPAGE